jgi:ribosome-associated protein
LIAGKRLARKLASLAFDRMGFDIELIDVRRVCDYTNYFLFVSGKNRVHLDALKEHLLDGAKEAGTKAHGLDGAAASGWIIMDFGDLIVHIFTPDAKNYYDLMSIWGDGKPVEMDPATPPVKPKTSSKKRK